MKKNAAEVIAKKIKKTMIDYLDLTHEKKSKKMIK